MENYWKDEITGYLEDCCEATYDKETKTYTLCNGVKVTEKQIEDCYNYVMANDYMWNAISETIADGLRKEAKIKLPWED